MRSGPTPPVVLDRLVRVVCVGRGVGVHRHRRQTGQLVEQRVLGFMGSGVGVGEGEVAVDGDVDFGPQLVTDPPETDAVNATDERGGAHGRLGGGDELLVDAVHQAVQHLLAGLDQDLHDQQAK